MLEQKVIEKWEDLLLEEDWAIAKEDDDAFYLPRHTPNDYNPFINPEFNATVWWI